MCNLYSMWFHRVHGSIVKTAHMRIIVVNWCRHRYLNILVFSLKEFFVTKIESFFTVCVDVMVGLQNE